MNKKVLVVDDEESIRMIFAEALEQAGFQAIAAAGGQEALNIQRVHSIQVIFLDLNMPDMNGIDLCRRLRANNPVAIIHAVTGFTSLFQLAECRLIGFDDYFAKPFSTKDLVRATELAFEKVTRWNQIITGRGA